MPKRLGITALLTLIGVLLTALLIVYLAFSAGPDAPAAVETEWVSAEGTVSWSDMDGVIIQAGSLDDALVLLGYGQARSRSWQAVLWRQAALGRLSEWFGPDALPMDRIMRKLEIADGARDAFDALDPDDRDALAHFSAGFNRALLSRDLNRSTPFLILGFQAEPWEAWHSLAIERLFAWLSSAPASPDSRPLPPEWQEADAALQQLLHFHGNAANWVAGVQDGASPYMGARFATGSSGIPLFVETELDYGTGRFTGLMVPGTVVSLIGRTHADAWALIGRGNRTVSSRIGALADMDTKHHRIADKAHEEVVVSHHLDGQLVVGTLPRATENAPVTLISWNGQTHPTDTGAWLRAIGGTAPRTRLLDEDGIRWAGAGWSVSGAPSVVLRPGSYLLFVTDAQEEISPQATVAGMSVPPPMTEWMNTTLSRAAEGTLADLLSFFPDSLVTDPREQEALRYLRNWNLEYGAGEPGASIVETLLFELPDSVRSPVLLQQALTRTVRTLSGRYGPDMSSWRWETVQERAVGFPGSTPGAADGGRPEERFTQKYQPVTIRAPGHPQTLVWGAPPSADSMRVTSAWEGAIDLRSGTLQYRRPSVEFNRFLGTFLTGDRPPEIRILHRSSTDESTTFSPRD